MPTPASGEGVIVSASTYLRVGRSSGSAITASGFPFRDGKHACECSRPRATKQLVANEFGGKTNPNLRKRGSFCLTLTSVDGAVSDVGTQFQVGIRNAVHHSICGAPEELGAQALQMAIPSLHAATWA